MASIETPEFQQSGSRIQKAMEEQSQTRLKELFEEMPNPIELILFSQLVINEVFSDAVRQAVRTVRSMSSAITFKEFDLSHDLATKYNVIATPTLLFNPNTHNIRWLGAPLGEEGLTFMEAIILLGFGQVELGEQARKVLDSIDSPRHIKIFVSPTCPYCPPQAVNGLKAAVAKPDLISLEIIDVQANQHLAERYNAFSTPTVYVNEKLIAQGVQSEELFMASLKALEQQAVFIPDNEAEEIDVDLVIIGGGPAGLTAGIYAARNGLTSVVVEKGALGGQVATTPVVENYPGLTQVGGKSLVDIMVNHALQYVNIFPAEEVMDIKLQEPMIVTTSRRRFNTKKVLLATGASYRRLGIPGEDALAGRGVSWCSTCDGPMFKDKKVIMVGGGDSAVTEALHLNNLGVAVTLIHRGDTLRAQFHLVDSLTKAGIGVMFETELKEIVGSDRVRSVVLKNNRTDQTSKIDIDGVFIAVGYEPTVGLAKKIGVKLTREGYIACDAQHRTNISGIYSAGDVEGGYKQIVTAAGQGAGAAMSIFQDLINPNVA